MPCHLPLLHTDNAMKAQKEISEGNQAQVRSSLYIMKIDSWSTCSMCETKALAPSPQSTFSKPLNLPSGWKHVQSLSVPSPTFPPSIISVLIPYAPCQDQSRTWTVLVRIVFAPVKGTLGSAMPNLPQMVCCFF